MWRFITRAVTLTICIHYTRIQCTYWLSLGVFSETIIHHLLKTMLDMPAANSDLKLSRRAAAQSNGRRRRVILRNTKPMSILNICLATLRNQFSGGYAKLNAQMPHIALNYCAFKDKWIAFSLHWSTAEQSTAREKIYSFIVSTVLCHAEAFLAYTKNCD